MPVKIAGEEITATLAHSGASVTVSLWGATVISWSAPSPGSEDAQLQERLFLSGKAIRDGSKPIRGGIPIVFPFFGPPTLEEHKVFPQHGFARNAKWEYSGEVFETDGPDSLSLKFELKSSSPSTSEITAKWTKPFHLISFVTLSTHQLGVRLHIENPAHSATRLQHQVLLHNYIKVNDQVQTVKVTDLEGITYTDKVAGGERVEDRKGGVTVTDATGSYTTDSVYREVSIKHPDSHTQAGGKPTAAYEIKWQTGGVSLKTTGFPDVVLWNPGAKGDEMGDMHAGGWKDFVCVEPGLVSVWNELSPGETWIGTQLFTTI